MHSLQLNNNVRRIRHVLVKCTLKWIALTAALLLLVAFVVLSFVQPLRWTRCYYQSR